MNARTYLFVPGDRPDRYSKAFASRADAVIIDLEDAVAPTSKDAARAALSAWLASEDGPSVLVRINAADSSWFEADLALVVRSSRVTSIMLPKASADSPWQTFGGKPVLPLIETAAGIESLRAVAHAPGVGRLAFGTLDLQADLGIEGDDDALAAFRSQVVLVTRLANLAAPVDGVCTSIDDAEALNAHAARARRFGFGGVLCIHPAQVAVMNAAFEPHAEQIAWAHRVLAAAASANGAAVAVDGKMVDRPVLLRAQALLSRSGNSRD
jgi:citrate lyase subunit beta/citryl-CoA lyase